MQKETNKSKFNWVRIHLWVGFVTLVVFVLTGQYMDKVLAHLVGMPDAPRMLYRSAHIYLLWSGLLNLSLGISLRDRTWARKYLCAIGSLLIVVAPVLILTAFFVEPTLTQFQRPFSRAANYGAALGVLLRVWGELRPKPQNSSRID